MRRFKNILAVYGDDIGSDDVFCQAVALARANGARLTLIDVISERYATSITVFERRKRLERLVPAVEKEGITDVEVVALAGAPFLRIIQQVLKGEHDLVIASADGGNSLRTVYFGSTATHLMRKCPCPVWIVKPGQSTHYTRILACVDPNPEQEDGMEMDKVIVQLGMSLADSNDAAFHVVHAWEVEGKDRDTIASEVRDSTRTAILRSHETRHRHRIDTLLEAVLPPDVEPKIHLMRGAPQRSIVELVDNEGIDLIVMGTVCRTGIPGFIIGNAAETILSVVRCGVLTVKPNGFVSPVSHEDERVYA